MMVDLKLTNRKLVERSLSIVMIATDAHYEADGATPDAAGRHVKTSLVMLLADVDADEPRARIERGDGFVRHAIAGTKPNP
ncbi:MAG: hypothetical protein IIC18_09135 [Bacteroidetes bacterium]|nr:hypothetical protein [Bacteroidota bacterium]